MSEQPPGTHDEIGSQAQPVEGLTSELSDGLTAPESTDATDPGIKKSNPAPGSPEDLLKQPPKVHRWDSEGFFP